MSFIDQIVQSITGKKAENKSSNEDKKSGFIDKILSFFQNQNQEPVYASNPEPIPTVTPEPTPTPMPEYRHPLYDDPSYYRGSMENRLKPDEMFSAAKKMEENHDVPMSYFLDTGAIESGGGRFLKQFNGGPGRGPVQFEMPLPPDLVREAGVDFDLDNFNPMSATDSADLFGRLLKAGRLDRWGKQGASWGSLDKAGKDIKDKLKTYYSPEEINQFIKNEDNWFE